VVCSILIAEKLEFEKAIEVCSVFDALLPTMKGENDTKQFVATNVSYFLFKNCRAVILSEVVAREHYCGL
jgi:hypothetical protein